MKVGDKYYHAGDYLIITDVFHDRVRYDYHFRNGVVRNYEDKIYNVLNNCQFASKLHDILN